MKFYDREKELAILQQAASRPESAMVVISGRRRVGKSRLVDEFLAKHKGLKAIIVPKEEKQVATDFAQLFSDHFKPTFNSVKDALEYFFAKSDERILYIDEFPNFLEVNPAIPYELQRLWEIYSGKTNKVLILSGSYVGMMDKIFTRQKAPLFNRATSKIILQPLGLEVIWRMQSDLGVKDPVQKVANYCIFGGIPYYYVLLERYGSAQPIERLFFDVGPLREEGQDVLRQEFGASYKKYFSILEAIGAGLVSAGVIANKMGISQTTLSKYLQSLQNDFKLIERRVPFGQNPLRSKKGVYAIKDNLLAFWFSHAHGKAAPPSQEELNVFVSKRFESLCIEFLLGWLGKKGDRVVKAGKWWGQVEVEKGKFEQREIDLIVETDKSVYVGECKWGGDKMGEREIGHLEVSARALKAKKQVRWVLFSKNGFNIRENGETLLFDAKRIGNGFLA
ncbi:MAG: ATP-binding protein [Candidatus Micrarchaeota archaeon]